MLRQGKAKALLESSRNSALAAVESYNKPNNKYRIESYIVLMIIAWTKLFHAYFQATIGEKFFYKEKNGRYKVVDGEKKAWELKECIKNFKKKSTVVISEAVVANLNLFISIRNKIEHRFWDGSELDIKLFGECQSMLYNYENLIIELFGEDYLLNTCLAYALQFSNMRTQNQIQSQKHLLSQDMKDIIKYIDKYKSDLSQEIYNSDEYSIKLLLIPKVSNTNRKELSIEYVKWDSLNDDDKEKYEKITTLIKDKLVFRNAPNYNLLKPSKVIKEVKSKTGYTISMNDHTMLWKAFCIRPLGDSTAKFDTNLKYCTYDEPHDDYVYTYEWVDFITNLINKYNFTKDIIREKCKGILKIDDYLE